FLTGHKIYKLIINFIAIFSVSILIALLLVCLCTLVIGIPFCRPTLYICIAMLIVEAIIIILSFSLKRILHWMGEMNVKSQKY
ncbi:MAG: hypothetical protein LIO58_05260, partial [Oscillospiraceae bacterium]|nr:hypothetical protein [Oscillospiraceae bacterium]